MKFRTTVSCDNWLAPRASFILVDINPDSISVLNRFRLHAESITKVESAAFNYISVFDCSADWFGNPTNDEDDDVEDLYDYIRSRVNLCASDWHDFTQGGAIKVEDSFELPEVYVQRVDMAQVRVRAYGFHYASMHLEADVYQQTADISFEKLV